MRTFVCLVGIALAGAACDYGVPGVNDASTRSDTGALDATASDSGGVRDGGLLTDAGDAGISDVGTSSQADAGPSTDMGVTDAADAGASGSASDAGGPADSGAADTGVPVCDYQTQQDVIVIEAEDLLLVADWVESSTSGGFSGRGYIEWTGTEHFNNPGVGAISVRLRFDNPGRYELQWRTQVGFGNSASDHNDTWARFPDTATSYGVSGPGQNESRRYPRPVCEDADFLRQVTALPNVSAASCVVGSSGDNWFKVYSSGALADWRWSARTSDGDAHRVHLEVPAAGVYTMELSARSSFSRIDRIVIHEERIANGTVRNLSRAVTPCP